MGSKTSLKERHGYEAASQEAEAKAETLATLEAKDKATDFKLLRSRSQSEAFREGSQANSRAEYLKQHWDISELLVFCTGVCKLPGPRKMQQQKKIRLVLEAEATLLKMQLDVGSEPTV